MGRGSRGAVATIDGREQRAAHSYDTLAVAKLDRSVKLGSDGRMDWPMQFGMFMAPFHPVGQNPTSALQRYLDLVVHLDHLGYDEAWIGEHHSAGYEIIASPEIFIATAAERTRHIKLGTGVNSLPYHHPLLLADRMVLLDHLRSEEHTSELQSHVSLLCRLLLEKKKEPS